MPLCERCDPVIRERLEQFASKHGISGCSFLYPHFRSQIDIVLPGLFELIESPQRWIGEREVPWFPISAERVANEQLHIELVTAPLPFVAAVVRVVCPHCHRSHRIVHIGANFYVLASHLSAHLVGRGLNDADLVDFAIELHSAHPRWNAFPPPHAVPRDILAYGMAWLMCHEIGHFASPGATVIPELDLPQEVRARLNEEAHADRMSFAAMLHRVIATPHLGQRIASALAGVFLVLNAWNLLIPKSCGRKSDITAYGVRLGAATPSPALRWDTVRVMYDWLVTVKLAGPEDHFPQLRDAAFPDLTNRMLGLQELLDARLAASHR